MLCLCYVRFVNNSIFRVLKLMLSIRQQVCAVVYVVSKIISKNFLFDEKNFSGIKNQSPIHFPGQTPLHYAMLAGAIENAVLLLRHGASNEMIDSFQLRPLNYCRTLNNKKIK